MATEEPVIDLTPLPASDMLDRLRFLDARRSDSFIDGPYDIVSAAAIECLPEGALGGQINWMTERLSDASTAFSVSFVAGTGAPSGDFRVECGGFILRKVSTAATLLRRVYLEPVIPIDIFKDEMSAWFLKRFREPSDPPDDEDEAAMERYRGRVAAVVDDAVAQVLAGLALDLGRQQAASAGSNLESETAMQPEGVQNNQVAGGGAVTPGGRVAHPTMGTVEYRGSVNSGYVLTLGENGVALSADPPRAGQESFAVPATSEGRKYLPQYNPRTAKLIADAVPAAWAWFNSDEGGGRWGPGCIAKKSAIAATTVGRYIKAFHKLGIHAINGVPLPP